MPVNMLRTCADDGPWVENFCFKVSWSPFEETRLAVATAQNFGIVGNGKLEILIATEKGIREIASFYTRGSSLRLQML
jgi:hypothetical protein